MGEDNTMTGKVFLQVDGEYQPMMELTEIPEIAPDSRVEENDNLINNACTDATLLVNTLHIRTVKRLIQKLLGFYSTGPRRKRNIGKAIRMMYWARVRSNRGLLP